jgi:uncharacterized integral membrane protein
MWLKIKVWTKVTLFALVFLYILIFLVMNGDRSVEFWYFYNRKPELPVLVLVLCAFLAGVLITILLRTTFTTLKQIRDLKSRGRAERLQREVEAMKTKAAMLRTKPGIEESAAASGDLAD